MFNSPLSFIATHYPFFLSLGVAILVTLRIFIVVFLERYYKWSNSPRQVAALFFITFGATYFTALLSFYVGVKIFQNQAFFILVYYLVILNAITIYVMRKPDEGLGFQFLTAMLNLFHIFFAIILISPPRYVNALNMHNQACVINSHCYQIDCNPDNIFQEKKPDTNSCFASRRCENYVCVCEKTQCRK